MKRAFVYSTIVVLMIALVAPEIIARGGARGGGGGRGGYHGGAGRSRGSVRYAGSHHKSYSRQVYRRDYGRRDQITRTSARTGSAARAGSAKRAATARTSATRSQAANRHRAAKRPSSARGGTAAQLPARGHRIRHLPSGYRRCYWHNRRWYYWRGVWYVPYYDDGDDDEEEDGYEVTLPPVGVTVSEIPEGAEKIEVDGKTQYVFAGIYYRPFWVNGSVKYEVVKVDEKAFAEATAGSTK